MTLNVVVFLWYSKFGDRMFIAPPFVPMFSENVLLINIKGAEFAIMKMGEMDSNMRAKASESISSRGSYISLKKYLAVDVVAVSSQVLK